jgi:hypothetical protein
MATEEETPVAAPEKQASSKADKTTVEPSKKKVEKKKSAKRPREETAQPERSRPTRERKEVQRLTVEAPKQDTEIVIKKVHRSAWIRICWKCNQFDLKIDKTFARLIASRLKKPQAD